MKPRKIVYFIDHLRADGTQRALTQLSRGLAEREYQQTVVCMRASWDEDIVSQLHEAAVNIRVIGEKPLISGYGLIQTWLWLRRQRFDVAVTFLFVSDVVGRWLAKAARLPQIITSLRARNIHYRGWQRWLVRQTMPWADVVVLNSVHVREFAVGVEGANPEKIRVVPNAVDVNLFVVLENRNELRTAFGIPVGVKVVGSIGRLTHQKGFDLLLRAVAALESQSLHLVIAGTGEEGAALRSLGNSLGLGDRLHLIGYCREIPKLMAALDVYVQPSRFEGMPNALMEAMAAGCPVIATAVDGSRELIEDGLHGWLTPPESVSGLSTAIQAVLNNPQEARRRGDMARQRIAHDFSLERMISAWEEILIEFVHG